MVEDVNNSGLLFLAVHKFENGAVIRGAALVTDNNTKPIEFRCTGPVRPTQMQKILYGNVLDEHLRVELISIPLIKSMRSKYSLMVVREPSLLKARTKTEMPIVLILKEQELGNDAFSEDKTAEGNQIYSQSGKFETLIVKSHPDYPNERDSARILLQEVMKNQSLLNPFERIEQALKQVHDSKQAE